MPAGSTSRRRCRPTEGTSTPTAPPRASAPSSRRTRSRTTAPSRSADTPRRTSAGRTRTASGRMTVARSPSRTTFVIPRKRATQSSAGRAQSSSGVATCATRPPGAPRRGRPGSRPRRRRGSRGRRSAELVEELPQIGPQAPPERAVERAERLVEEQHAVRGASARASATRCCSPPDSVSTSRRSRPARPTRSSTSLTRARRSLAVARPASAGRRRRFRATSRCGKSASSWNIEPMRRTVRRHAGQSTAVEQDRAPPRRLEPCDHAEQRRLAASRSGRAAASALARADVERHVVEDPARRRW